MDTPSSTRIDLEAVMLWSNLLHRVNVVSVRFVCRVSGVYSCLRRGLSCSYVGDEA